MEHLIDVIRREEPVTEEDARRLFSVLQPVIDQAPDDAEARSVAASIIQRMEHGSHLTALLDWWLVVTTGGAPATGLAYALPDDMPSILTDAMSSALTLSTPVPVATWVKVNAEFNSRLAQLEERLSLDWYGKTKLPGERNAWAGIVEEFSSTITALRDSTEAPTPTLSSTHLDRYLRESGIEENSRRWKEMAKRSRQLAEFLEECVMLQRQVEPWVARNSPPTVDIDDSSLGFGPGSLEAQLIRCITLDPATGSEGEVAAILGEIAAVAASGDRSALTAMARITDSWYRSVSPSVPTNLRVPDYDSVVASLHRIEAEIDQLAQSGVDVTEALLAIMEDDLDAADQAVKTARASQRQSTAHSALAGSLKALREDVIDLGLLDLLADELDTTQKLLDSGDVDGTRAGISSIESRIDSETRSSTLAELEVLAASLERLSASQDDIAEIREMIAGVHHGDKVDQRSKDRFVGLVDESKRQLLDEATDDIGAIRALLGEVSHVPPTERIRWEDQVEELGARLVEARRTLDIDDIILVADEAASLLAGIEQHRIVRWMASMGEESLVNHIVDYCTQQMAFGVTDIQRFYVAVKTKPFVILSGLTGSGKSTIVRLFAESLGATAANRGYRRIAVRPDWIDQSEVLGYINPLNSVFQPGWLARVMSECNASPNRMFVVLLDELNLAPVEQFLAEYLSAGEEARSGSNDVRVPLYPEGSHVVNADEWPAELTFPENLIIVGTVNMDETTRVLSDRVLDRANVLQLDVGISSDHHEVRPVAVAPWEVPFTEWRRLCRREPAIDFHDLLVDVADQMRTGLRIGLGVRAHIEIERFVANAAGTIDAVEALDLAMLQRVIPKIKGFKRDLMEGLDDLEELFTSAGARRCARVVSDWLDESVPDDDYLDGTSHRVGLIA